MNGDRFSMKMHYELNAKIIFEAFMKKKRKEKSREYAKPGVELTHLILKHKGKKGLAFLLRTVQFHEPAESAMFTFLCTEEEK